jgi:hypothetical protein
VAVRKINAEAGSKFYEIVGSSDLDSLHEADLPQLYRETLEAGWMESDGSWFLKKLRDEYYGSESQFTDHTGYESAVNGRAIPEEGVQASTESAARLAARGLTFARHALERLPAEAPPVTAYISISKAIYDDAVVEGSVTFCADHEGEPPYATDLDSFQGGLASVRSVQPVAQH